MKYAWYEQKNNKVMTGLIFFQTVVVLIVTVSIISAIVSRYEQYRPLERFFQGRGLNMHVWMINGRDGRKDSTFLESSDLECYLKKAHVVSSYDVQITFDIDGLHETNPFTHSRTIGYDDELITAYTPELEDGRWLKPDDAETDIIEVVVAQIDQKYKVGDIITLTTSDVVKEEAGFKLSTPIQAKVVGILADGASPIMRVIDYGEYEDFRDYFYPFYRSEEKRSIVFVSKRDIEHNNNIYAGQQKDLIEDEDMIWPYSISGPCFILYDESITQEEMDYNANYLLVNGWYWFRHSSEEMRESSMKYIMGQMNMLIPILIALIILTLMSIVVNTVIMIRQNLQNYSIYYMLGLTWKKCVVIHSRSVIIMQLGAFLFTMFGFFICVKTGVLAQTVFFIGRWQLLGCLVVALLFVLFSVVLSFLLIGRKSANDIFRQID